MQWTCRGMAHLAECLHKVELGGGEGLMIRAPGSAYVEGVTAQMLKVKSFSDDEATVTGYVAGKHPVGSIAVNWNGKRFNIGAGINERVRANPPAVGASVTFRYQGTTKSGLPRFASYVGERLDK